MLTREHDHSNGRRVEVQNSVEFKDGFLVAVQSYWRGVCGKVITRYKHASLAKNFLVSRYVQRKCKIADDMRWPTSSPSWSSSQIATNSILSSNALSFLALSSSEPEFQTSMHGESNSIRKTDLPCEMDTPTKAHACKWQRKQNWVDPGSVLTQG